jgi:hypothetical protein
MMWQRIRTRRLALIGLGFGWTLGLVGIAAPTKAGDLFVARSLATDATDAQLINPWGISASGTSPFWISDNGAGVSTLFSLDPTTNVATQRRVGRSVGRPAISSGAKFRSPGDDLDRGHVGGLGMVDVLTG